MTREYDWYVSKLGPALAQELRAKLKLAISRMGRYSWYAASVTSNGGPDTGEMWTVAFLFAAEAMMDGETDVHEAMKLGLREAVRLAQHDSAAYLYHPKEYQEDGTVVARTIISDTEFHTGHLWSDDDGEGYYSRVESSIDAGILRQQVSDLLTGPERVAVLALLDDPDSDEYGWKARKAGELGWSRETFNTRLERGLTTVREELFDGRTHQTQGVS